MTKRKTYIPSSNFWKEAITRHGLHDMWSPVDKVPLEKIKVEKSLMEYQNEVDYREVLRILVNFDPELWEPILVNEDYYLLDGQHRLKVAKQLCLKHIDVICRRQETEVLSGPA